MASGNSNAKSSLLLPFHCMPCSTCLHSDPGTLYLHLCRPFRGLIKDMTRCYNLYRSDFSAAISLQVIASLILIYFANITQAFTFGAVLSDHTNSTLVRERRVWFRYCSLVWLSFETVDPHISELALFIQTDRLSNF